MVLAVVLVAGAYLLGTLPVAAVVAARSGHDPTREGSGNPGATNVYRTAGRGAGAAVLAGDLVKGAAAAGVGWLVGDHLLGVVCGTAAVVGHVLPITRGLRGGKGVATAGGVTLVTFPLVGVAAAATWLLVAKVTRRASVGSLVAAAAIPVGAAVSGAPAAEVLLLAGVAVLILVRHAGNIGRLIRGTEPAVETGAS